MKKTIAAFNLVIDKITKFAKSIYSIGAIYQKFRYWYPILRDDRNDDFICLYAIIHHKLKSVRTDLYPNGFSSIDAAIKKFDLIVKMEFETTTEMQNAVNDAFNQLGVNSTRWYK